MITDNFSWIRVGMLLKRYFAQNRRSLLMVLAVFFGLMLFIGLMISRYVDGAPERLSMYWFIAIWITILAYTITASLTFSSLTTKQRRLTEMMVPATKFEKFTTCIIIYVIIFPVAIWISDAAADILSAVVFGHLPSIFYFFSILDEFNFEGLSDTIGAVHAFFFIVALLYGIILFSQSIYTLGSAWWPKKSFIKTSLVMYGAQMLLPLFIPWESLGNLMDWLFKGFDDSNNIMPLVTMWSFVLIIFLVDFGVFALAWRRFKNTQLVQKFMMN